MKEKGTSLKNSIIRKLKSSSGVTILLALLCFLVVAMVCAVIVAAALSSAKSSKENTVAIQNRLDVESAALFLRAEIDGATFKRVTVTEGTVEKDPVVTVTDCAFQPEIRAVVSELESELPWTELAGESVYSSPITTKISTNKDELPTVSAGYILKNMGSKTYQQVYTFVLDGDTRADEILKETFSIVKTTDTYNYKKEYVKDGTKYYIDCKRVTEVYRWTFNTISCSSESTE